MQVIEDFKFGSGRGRSPKVDYTPMFDGQKRLLEAGVDFTSKPESVQQTLRNAAKKAGLGVRIGKHPKGIAFQSYVPQQNKPAEKPLVDEKAETTENQEEETAGMDSDEHETIAAIPEGDEVTEVVIHSHKKRNGKGRNAKSEGK